MFSKGNMAHISHLQCSRCGSIFEPVQSPTVCGKCAGALYVRYDLDAIRALNLRDGIGKESDQNRWPGLRRYHPVLPDVEPVTLGEGWTPMLPSRRYKNLYLKEEGANPTGTFKARGLSLAISMLRSYGVKK